MKKHQKNNTFIRKYKTYLILSVLIIVMVIILSNKIMPNKLMGNLYNLEEISTNIDRIKVGDSINYEINGYSDWKVLYIDKKNNTIDVISNTSPETLTFKGQAGYDSYLQTLQEHADMYVDGSVAIKARSVNKGDLDNFTFDEEIWLANVYDNKIATNSNTYQLKRIDNYGQRYFDNMYIIPYIRVLDEDLYSYNPGDIYNFSINGIEEWFVIGRWDYGYNNRGVELIAKDPIKVELSDLTDYDVKGYVESLLNSFSDPKITEVRKADYGYINYNSDIIKNYYVDNYKNIFLIRDVYDRQESTNYYDRTGFNINFDFCDGSQFTCCNSSELYDYNFFYTFGFRPVVTLKFSDDVVNEKDLNTNLTPGDYVNYSANEYQNWKVLSIDYNNKTAEIISGGIVKNLELKGKDGYDNLESLLEEEVNKYKKEGVISARSVRYEDLDNLNAINDKVNAKYWLNNKKNYNRKYNEGSSAKYYSVSTRVVGAMYFDEADFQNKRDWIVLTGQTADNISMTSDVFKEGSYIAGIRPVLTVKLEEIAKVDDETKEEIINNTTSQDDEIVSEQSSKNDNNKAMTEKQLNEYINESNNNSVDNNVNNTTINNDNTNIENNDGIKVIEKDHNCLDKGYKRFVIGALIAIIIIFIINTIIALFILKKISNKKR